MENESQIIVGKKTRSWHLSFWMRFLIALTLLFLVFEVVNIDDLAAAFRDANLLFLSGAGFLLVGNVGIQIIKWNYMLRFVDNVSRKQTVASLFFGMTLGSFTPGQLGEYGGRAIHLPSENWGTVIGLAVIDRLQISGVMALGGLFSFIVLYEAYSPFVIMAWAALSLLIVIVMVRFSIMRAFLDKLGISKLKYAWVRQATDSLSLFTGTHIAVTTGLSALFYGIVYLQLFLLMNAFQAIDPLNSFLAFAAMMFSKTLLPFSIADLGVREFGLVYFASRIGYPAAAALASAFLLFFINIVIPALVGILFIPSSMSFTTKEQ